MQQVYQSFNHAIIHSINFCNFCALCRNSICIWCHIWRLHIFGIFYAEYTHKFIRPWLNYKYWITVWLGVVSARGTKGEGFLLVLQLRCTRESYLPVCPNYVAESTLSLSPTRWVCVKSTLLRGIGSKEEGEWTLLAAAALSTWTRPQSHFSCGNEM